MKIKNTFFFLNLIALCLFFSAVVRLIDYKNWATGAHYVTWVDGLTGEQIPNIRQDSKKGWRGCGYSDDSVLRVGTSLWTLCKSHKHHNAMVHIDLESKIGTVWRSPNGMTIFELKGMDVNEKGHVAFVGGKAANRLDEIQLVVGVVDDEGWILPPMVLPDTRSDKLRAILWHNQNLNIVYRKTQFGREEKLPELPMNIVRIRDAEIEVSRFTQPDEHCRDFECYHSPCRVYLKDSRWQATIQRWKRFKGGADFEGMRFVEVNEQGHLNYLNNESACPTTEILSRDFDAASVGDLSKPIFPFMKGMVAFRQHLNGEFEEIPIPFDSWVFDYDEGWYESNLERNKTPGLWTNFIFATLSGEEANSFGRQINNEWVVITETENRHQWELYRWEDQHQEKIEGNKEPQTLVRLNSCEYLPAKGVPVNKQDGGFWFVSTQGCYIEFDDDLNRVDQLSIYEHLSSRGSNRANIHETRHFVKLLVVLLGIPILVLLFPLLSRLEECRKFTVLNWFALAYIAGGGLCLYQVYPLLF